MWLLSALPRISGWIVHSMHRVTAIEGAVPRAGPALLVANHPSGLIDPLVVSVAAERPVRWLAKSTLVFHPLLGWLFRAAGCIPVYRRQDDPTQMDRNLDAFRAAVDVLAAGNAVAMFPEGISHHSPGLAPMKTGAARLALSASAAIGGPIPIIPIGVIYRDAPTFRSEAGVVVGQPIEWWDLASREAEDRAAAQELTERIGAGLANVTRDLDTWADQAIVEHAAAVLAAQSPGGTAPPSWIARGSAMLTRMDEAHDPALPALRQRLRAHSRALKRLELSPAELAANAQPRIPRYWRGWRVPLAAFTWSIGRLWTWPPYRATGALATRLAPDQDTLGTFKAAIGIVLFTVWIGLTSVLVGRTAGTLWGWLALPACTALAFLTLRLEEARQRARTAQRISTWRARKSEVLEQLR
ncbi:MAG TPA: 1-acyl-sn-glycerol-3-phosphate acyltransferase, partial [Gemmatimonadales bacterium]|nr:1-acyl-sn-glycerol-3-phosphate acyltransferase [Gemmatimonadales bacterium]